MWVLQTGDDLNLVQEPLGTEREVRPTIYSAMLKLFASDVAMQVTTDAVQVFGGSGYIRDAKITQIY